MKAITVPQPRAAFVAVGATAILTMDWATAYRGPLAIHAAARKPSRDDCRPAGDYRIRATGSYAGGSYILEGPGLPEYRSTPRPQGYIMRFGSIVALCELVDVVRIVGPDEQVSPAGSPCLVAEGSTLTLWDSADYWHNEQDERDVSDQRPYGDFTPGHFAWSIRNVLPIDPLDPPIKRRGRGGLWDAALDSHP